MDLHGIADAVERHLAEVSDPAQSHKKRAQTGTVMGLIGTALIFLLIVGFFINLALATVTGIGINEATFGKIAIMVMALALPILFGGAGLMIFPAIQRGLFKTRSTDSRLALQGTAKQAPLASNGTLLESPAGRFDAISSVTEHTTAELESRLPERESNTS